MPVGRHRLLLCCVALLGTGAALLVYWLILAPFLLDRRFGRIVVGQTFAEVCATLGNPDYDSGIGKMPPFASPSPDSSRLIGYHGMPLAPELYIVTFDHDLKVLSKDYYVSP
jgi:hypothetical protein